MGGAELAPPDIDALAAYLVTLRNHPNPNLRRDGTPPPTLAGGDPLRGADLFTVHNNHCNLCHTVPRGTNNVIDLPQEVGSSQPLKNPSLRTVYQRLFFNPQAGQPSLSGFGLNHDGSGFALPKVHPYVLDELGTESPNDFADVTAFVLCFPTETKPAVGDGLTVTASSAGAAVADLAVLEAQARAQASDLTARGLLGGKMRSFFYNRTTQIYEPDSAAEPALTRAQLLALVGANDALTFLGTPPGEGRRHGGDRDGDGLRDRDEPSPALGISALGIAAVRLQWLAGSGEWTLESAAAPDGPWQAVTGPRDNVAGWLQRDESLAGPARFYRLRRTW
jgi:hypothetical protein